MLDVNVSAGPREFDDDAPTETLKYTKGSVITRRRFFM